MVNKVPSQKSISLTDKNFYLRDTTKGVISTKIKQWVDSIYDIGQCNS
jgi:hypothetical protein